MISSCSPIALLRRSLDYALAGIATVEPSMLCRQTPCSEWDLHDLLFHLADSMLTLGDLLGGSVGDVSGCGAVTRAADAALDLQRTITSGLASSVRTIGGLPIAQDVIVVAGALEVAVHTWDVEQVSADPEPIPVSLAQDLLAHAPFLLHSTLRRNLFAAPIELPSGASASDRLVAFAGRPTWQAVLADAERNNAAAGQGVATGSGMRPSCIANSVWS